MVYHRGFSASFDWSRLLWRETHNESLVMNYQQVSAIIHLFFNAVAIEVAILTKDKKNGSMCINEYVCCASACVCLGSDSK